MIEQSDYIGLDWVIGEIDSTLTEARLDLEQYADSGNDSTLLDSCRTKIQQIHSTLKILKQKGARLLTREILLLLDSLKSSPAENAQEQLVVLIQAMLQLPGYLAHTSRSGKDTPSLLKNLLSEMRQLRGQHALSDIDFFTPDLSSINSVHAIAPISQAQLDKLQSNGFASLVRKIRQKYQLCLAGVLRDSQREQQLATIGKIFAKLQNLCWGSPISPLWDAITAFSEGLKEGSIAIDNHAITILREMDHELKCLTNEETRRLNTPPQEELLREILFRIGKANSDNSLILSLKRRYSLDKALDRALESEFKDVSLISFDAAAPVVKAIKEELAHVKDALDLYLLNPEINKTRLKEQLTTCQQISDTLCMLGLDKLQVIMQKESEHLKVILSSEQAHEQISDTLINTAAQLLEVEAGLNQFMGFSRPVTNQPSISAQMNDIHQTVIHEARENLEQAKGTVVDYLSEHNQEFLVKLLPLMKSIQGGLAIIPLNRVAGLISRCSQHIQSQWLEKSIKPSLEELEALADTLSSIEYYLEQLSGGASLHAEKTLDITQESLDKLEASKETPEVAITPAKNESTAKVNPFSVHLLSDEERAAQEKEAAENQVIEFRYDEPISLSTTITDSREKDVDYGPTIEFTIDSLPPVPESIQEQEISFSPPIDLAELESLLPTEKASDGQETEVDDLPLSIDFSLNEDDLPALEGLSLTIDPLSNDGLSPTKHSLNENDTLQIDDISEDLTSSDRLHTNAPPSIEASFSTSFEDSDDDIHEIFVEEASEVQQQLEAYFAVWCRNINDEACMNDIRRSFHTLKGSGRMVGAEVIGELAWSIENMLNSVIDDAITTSQPMLELLGEVINMLPELVHDFAADSQQLTPEVLICMEKADALGKGISFIIEHDEPEEIDTQEPAILFGNIIEESPAETDQNSDTVESASFVETVTPSDDLPTEVSVAIDPEPEYDQQLLEIFVSEARGHLSAVKSFIESSWQPGGNIQISDTVQGALHTLKGSAFMAEITPLAELIAAIEKTIREFRAHLVPADNQVISMLEQGVDLIEDALLQLQTAPQSLELKVDSFLNWLNALHNQLLSNSLKDGLKDESTSERSPENQHSSLKAGQQAALFLASDLDLLLDASGHLKTWVNGIAIEELDQFKFELRVLAENATDAGLSAIAELCDVLLDVCVYLETHETVLPEQLLPPFIDGFEALVEMMNQVASQQTPESPQTVFSALREALESLLFRQTSNVAEPSTAEPDDFTDQEAEKNSDDASFEFILDSDAEEEIVLSSIADKNFQEPEFQSESPVAPAEGTPPDPFINEAESDQELRKLFIEEAYELLEDSAQSLERWLSAPNELQPVHELQRCLHTLKGGAMMAELSELGELSHALEDVYESITNGSCEPENAPLALIQKTHDTIEVILKAHSEVTLKAHSEVTLKAHSEVTLKAHSEVTLKTLGTGESSPDALRMLEELRQWKNRLNSDSSTVNDIEVLPDYLGQTSVSEPVSHKVFEDNWISDLSDLPQPVLPEQQSEQHAELTPDPVSTIRVAPQTTADTEGSALQTSSSEMVRVPSELLETLINLAGETSISRSRIEQQTADATRTLEEMNRTILRVREQIRRLDIETQTQIISRHQGDFGDNPDFDPLEMDQYSELSQLSHSLVESASDLMDLREALQEKTRDTETLLQQQSRTQIELQEKLMKARMVSFSRLVPRLRKIVRLVSDDLGKPVELLISNAEGEMDRTMLERILAPLEHMLRNAIGHGIEDTPEERRKSGKPESGQISLSIRRDGADVLVELSDDGRGINIETVKARAVEQKLISPDGHITDQEAIELIMKSGFSTATNVTHLSGRGVGLDVVNTSVRQLGGSIQIKSETGQGTHFSLRLPFTLSINRALMVEVGNSLYALPMHAIDGIAMVSSGMLADCYINKAPLVYGNGTEHQLIYMGALIGTASPKISDGQCPVILVQRGSENIAVQVDSIVGSREIITKSLGAQFSGLAGVNGATILGDGRVVVILDPAALYRKHQLSIQEAIQEARPEAVERYEPDNSDQPVRVLVVDDSVTVRKVTSRLLARQGYEVTSARDGVEAMTLLSEHKPDIMLLDIEMPRMDGFEVASAVRNDPQLQDLPIIMITSRTGEKHRNRAFSLGVNEYIGKPFQEGPLLEAIEKLLVVETT